MRAYTHDLSGEPISLPFLLLVVRSALVQLGGVEILVPRRFGPKESFIGLELIPSTSGNGTKGLCLTMGPVTIDLVSVLVLVLVLVGVFGTWRPGFQFSLFRAC